MKSATSNKNLLFIIAVLLLTNIAVLVYFLAYKKDHEPKKTMSRSSGLSDILKKEVGFDDSQVARYKELKEEQSARIRPLYDEMRKAKDSLFRLMGDSTVSDSVISQAGDAIAQRQKLLDLEAFDHFRKVRALCANPDQQVKYDSAILRMFRKMGKPSRHGSPENKEKK